MADGQEVHVHEYQFAPGQLRSMFGKHVTSPVQRGPHCPWPCQTACSGAGGRKTAYEWVTPEVVCSAREAKQSWIPLQLAPPKARDPRIGWLEMETQP